jgi:divalent metal cation (Fe/Co/Zn/Cd) transporter
MEDLGRSRLLGSALRLSFISVAWGVVSGGASVAIGLIDGSLAVLGLGLNVLADVAGSAVLVWRFRAELHHAAHAAEVEARAATVVAAALTIVSLVLTEEAIRALATSSEPTSSARAIIAAGLAIMVLTPLAVAKRRVAAQLGSPSLRADATLSGIGAGVAVLALTGLALDGAFGWWWADRVAALVVAAIAAAEAVRVARAR